MAENGHGFILLHQLKGKSVSTFRKITDPILNLDKQIADGQRSVHQLLYDSRLISNGIDGIFFALTSSKADGHTFIPEIAEKGVNQWIVSDRTWATWLERKGDQNWLLVSDVLATMQEIAARHRNQFQIPVIGITGSNGKTIVKEWLTQLIGTDYFVCKSPKSFNSQIGVALSVWNLAQGHTLGIFEAGISRKGEMLNLQKMINPTLGIFTNLGTAHDDGFQSQEEKLDEKLRLFSQAKEVLIQADFFNQFQDRLVQSLPHAKWLLWRWQVNVDGTFSHVFNQTALPFRLAFTDKASLENQGHAIAAARHLGVEFGAIQTRLLLLSQPHMRLSLKEGQSGITLVDDSYTNDLEGLEAALQFAVLQRKPGQRLALVLSAADQANVSLSQLSIRLLYLVSVFEVDYLFTIGIQRLNFPADHPVKVRYYDSSRALLESVKPGHLADFLVLIKGSRKFALENVVQAWQKKIHGTRLEIHLDALVNNLNFYRSQLPKGTGIMAMVKALGYGSGGEEIARILQYHQVDYLAVAYADEGIKLREEGITLPIMVMNPMPETMENLIRYRLQPEIYNFRTMEAFLEACANLNGAEIPAIHLKIDTGMHRLGFFPAELPELSAILKNYPEIQIETIFSHLAGADDDQLTDYTLVQIERFEQGADMLQSVLNQPIKRHIVNSAGILRFPQATYDLVRLGIGLYGIEVNSWYQNQLSPVSSLKTTISQIKELKAGETVGYSRKGLLTRDSTIATIAIGYADGFLRHFSNGNARVKVSNQWVPTVGNVCMDMTMIDVTGLNVQEGEEVIIFDDADSLLRLAQAAGTIPYEILTGIGQRVRRIFYRE